jgi:hypothetical protein
MKRKKGRPKRKKNKGSAGEQKGEIPEDENREEDSGKKERGWLALIGLLIVLFLILGCPPQPGTLRSRGGLG